MKASPATKHTHPCMEITRPKNTRKGAETSAIATAVSPNDSGREGKLKKETGRGTFAGYDVSGWRYLDSATWHVKLWPATRPSEWIGYTVTGGEFELKMLAIPQKEAVLHLIREWETVYSNATA